MIKAFLAAVFIPSLVVGLSTQIEEGGMFCVSKSMGKSDKGHLTWHVYAGGLLDANFKVYDPNGKVIFEEDRTSGESVAWLAQVPGIYKICWLNTMSKATAKHITWELTAGNTLMSKEVAKVEHLDPLTNSVAMLSQSLRAVADEQKYIKVRERVASNTNQSTNSRVLWWSLLETVILIGMSIWKIWYLRSFFENKRTVH